MNTRRVRILNTKSAERGTPYYLGLEGNKDNWTNYDASLTIRAFDGAYSPDSSPQVWTIVPFHDTFLMLNQYSGFIASIRGRDTGNGATAIQYFRQITPEPFQQWQFSDTAGSVLIQNVNSGKYLGPHGRDINNDNYVVQYENQQSEDDYQLWRLEDM